jgi:hypothetical protein
MYTWSRLMVFIGFSWDELSCSVDKETDLANTQSHVAMEVSRLIAERQMRLINCFQQSLRGSCGAGNLVP